MNNELFDFIKKSPTAFHAVSNAREMLLSEGYTELSESEEWRIERGRGYFVTRNLSSIIAFRAPMGEPGGFMIAASHCDSPCFKVKENAELGDGNYTRLSVERYGGMLCAPWLDRPLSIAGRVLVRTEKGVGTELVALDDTTVVIPNVAIHMNRNANTDMSYNAAVDMLPLYGSKGARPLKARIAEALGVTEKDILATDLFVYDPEEGREWGGFISAPRLDDLQCAFSALKAFIASKKSDDRIPVCAVFDNEEVGSTTKQGAASTFLRDVLTRAVTALGGNGESYLSMVANSLLVSCDNAHAVHPNHPEYSDKNHSVFMNGGVVIKYNANQKYTSDGVSSAIFRLICDGAGVPVQYYANRADLPGGSTLGNIANTQVSLVSVDIGLAQLAMHSAYETAGAADTEYMVRALEAFYSTSIEMTSDGSFELG